MLKMEDDVLTRIVHEIQPFPYDGDNIDVEFEQINHVLMDSDHESRDSAMRILAGMAMAHEVDDNEFGERLETLKDALVLQVLFILNLYEMRNQTILSADI